MLSQRPLAPHAKSRSTPIINPKPCHFVKQFLFNKFREMASARIRFEKHKISDMPVCYDILEKDICNCTQKKKSFSCCLGNSYDPSRVCNYFFLGGEKP